jgi:tetratricopeptide (TPR) repeat protein
MGRAPHPAASCFRAALLFAAFGVTVVCLPAQPQRKSPAKPPAQSSSLPKQDPLAPLLLQAKDAIDKDDFATALEPLQKYIAQRPDDPYAHFQLGYAYAGLKRLEEAKAEFSRAIALDPKMAPAHLNLGLALMESDPGGAADSFRRAADLQPAESRPRFLAGFALEHAGNLTQAIEQYGAALAIAPKNYEYHFALGRALLRAGDAPGAEEHFREAVAARGDAAPARLGLANALLTQKKYQTGTDALGEYLKLKPDDRAERLDRVSALMEIDRFDDALAELDRAEAGSAPTAEGLKMRGNIYLHQDKWKEAGDTLAQAIRQSPQDQELPTWLGHAEIELHDYPAAINHLGKVVANNPQAVDALRDLVSAFFLNEDYAATLGGLDRLAQLETPKPTSWFIRAICYDKLSRKPEAIEAYQKFLDTDNGQNETQDFQARRRALTLQSELGQAPKKQKH